MDKLLDCDKYVENGFQIQYKGSQIKANETTGVYCKINSDKPLKHVTFYKPYNYLGLFEALRLKKIAEDKKIPSKIDSQAIFDFFENKSILNVSELTLKMFDGLIKKWADTNLDAEEDLEGKEFENADYRRIKYLLHFKSHFEK